MERNASQVGHIYEVLVERRSPKDAAKWKGLNRQGKTINFPAQRDLLGQLVRVKAVKSHLWGFTGEMLPARSERGLELMMAED